MDVNMASIAFGFALRILSITHPSAVVTPSQIVSKAGVKMPFNFFQNWTKPLPKLLFVSLSTHDSVAASSTSSNDASISSAASVTPDASAFADVSRMFSSSKEARDFCACSAASPVDSIASDISYCFFAASAELFTDFPKITLTSCAMPRVTSATSPSIVSSAGATASYIGWNAVKRFPLMRARLSANFSFVFIILPR